MPGRSQSPGMPTHYGRWFFFTVNYNNASKSPLDACNCHKHRRTKRKWRGDTTKTRKSPMACSSGKFPAYHMGSRAIHKCQYANCQRQRGEKSWGNLRIGVKSEVVYSRRSSVHGKCIETVAIRAEESVLKKINRRNSNSNYACILHKGRRWKCQKKIYRTRSHKIIGFVNWRII